MSVKQMLDAMRMLKDRLAFNEPITQRQLNELDDLLEEIRQARNEFNR